MFAITKSSESSVWLIYKFYYFCVYYIFGKEGFVYIIQDIDYISVAEL